MSWSTAISYFVSSLLAMAIVVAIAFGLCAVMYSSKLSRIEEHERRPISAGEAIRFLCAIPERGIEAGETGRVYMVYPGDDLEYWVSLDRDPRIRTKFLHHELWQLERV